mmetsp:Transcript_14630/g.31536  ORF Transcript_14630/g.31536 Transcript_14630/m.31536 type:complete len:185 (-) Transcript_14630:1461-2015(-)
MTKDPTHIPDNVQAILKGLPVKDQVVLRAYIASLREHVKGLEHKLLAAEDGDEHAHYHGHEKCTSDHGHSDPHHDKEEECAEHHDHEHKHEDKHEHGHEHKHEHEHEHEHEHGHKHEDKHDHHDHSHGHGHDHSDKKEDEDIPAWKKKAMESSNDDPMAAPFGGSWNMESSVDATADKKPKMEE